MDARCAHKKADLVGCSSSSSAAFQELPSYETLAAEMESLQRHLSQTDSPTVLCHNDLLTKNIIYNREEGEENLLASDKMVYDIFSFIDRKQQNTSEEKNLSFYN